MTLSFILSLILSISPALRYFFLFLLVAVEGPLVTMVAGYLGADHFLNIFISYFVIICADVISDSAYFSVGWWGGKKVEQEYRLVNSLSSKRLSRIKSWFHQNPRKSIVVGKLTHVVGVPVIMMAGMSRVNFWTFLVFDTIATIPKSLLFILVGYYFGPASEVLSGYLKYGTYLMSSLIIILFILYIFLGFYFEKKISDK